MPLWGIDRKRRRLLALAPEGPLRQALGTAWPEPSTDVHESPLLALDFETTGLDPDRDDIVSAGWVRIEGQRVVLSSSRHVLVRPRGAVSPASVAVHGITDDHVEQGVDLPALLEELLPVLAGRALVGHHAALDAAFLSAACRRCYGTAWSGPVIDTLALLEGMLRRRQQPIAAGSLRLATARRRHGLPHYPEHDALWDAIAAAELWLALAAELRGTGSLSLDRVQRILP